MIQLVPLGVFVGIVCFMEAGRRLGRWRAEHGREDSGSLFTAVEASLFGLMGLVVAFTFSEAATRYEMKRDLLVQEANAVGTAWLRIELLPIPRQAPMRERFRRYLDSRLAFYQRITDIQAGRHWIDESKKLQGEIWEDAVAGCREAPTTATSILFLPSLNAMFDIMAARVAAMQMHAPKPVIAQLVALPVICALFAGLSAASRPRRSWVHILGYASMLAITVGVILDLEYPRVGLIRLDVFDQALKELRASMEGI